MTALLRLMREGDLSQALCLSSLVGWNQTERDWKMLYEVGGYGCFSAIMQDKLVGTVTTIRYHEKIAWIGMLLVDPGHRKQGIGGSLIRAAVDHCREAVDQVCLDATPQGRRLYDRLGFQERFTLHRLVFEKIKTPVSKPGYCLPLTVNSLEDILEFDARVFGVARRNLLPHLWINYPHLAYTLYERGDLVGFCLGREGRQFTHIGPVEADNESSAQTLIESALAASRQAAVILDVPAYQHSWMLWLESMGFRTQRPLIRMGLGVSGFDLQPENQYAIAGPEIG